MGTSKRDKRDAQVDVQYPKGSKWRDRLRREHVCSVFEGKDAGEDKGNMICSPVLEVALEWLVDHCIRRAHDGRPMVLIGSTNHLDTKDYVEQYSDGMVMTSLRSLIVHGTRQETSCASHHAYIDFLQANFQRILVPYVLDDGHVLVMEVEYRAEKHRVKVWDTVGAWAEHQVHKIPQVEVVVCSFFKEGQDLEIAYTRAVTCNPTLPSHHDHKGAKGASAAFAFYIMAHLAQNKIPPRAGAVDEGFMRNYMWGCIRGAMMLPLPKIKFVK